MNEALEKRYNDLEAALKASPNNYKISDIQRYVGYCKTTETSVHTSGAEKGHIKNPWFGKLPVEKLKEFFERVHNEGLTFDGNHITIQRTGVTYDYVAYKNKMLVAYPESIIDDQLVYAGDKYAFRKESGSVQYTHEFGDPFKRNEEDIIGGYCVIKNARGEFIVTLTKDEFEKHRKVAKQDYIWAAWYAEMCLKTLIKKAVKAHYDDIFQTMEETDNVLYDLSKAPQKNPAVDRLKKFLLDVDDMTKLKAVEENCIKFKLGAEYDEAFDRISDLQFEKEAGNE